MRQLISFVCLSFLLVAVPGYGQITVENNYLPAPGTVIQSKDDVSVDETFFNALTSGSGGPMLWDFTGRTYGPTQSSTVISLAGTPEIATFPEANLVLRTVEETDTSWSIFKSNMAVFWHLGMVTRTGSETPIVIAYQDSSADYVFPIEYGNQWTSYRHWRQNLDLTIYTDTYDTTHYHADAFGSVKYGGNTVPVLRVVAHERYTNKTYDDGILIFTSIADWTSVGFIAAGNLVPVSAWKIETTGITMYGGSAGGEFLGLPTDTHEDDPANRPTAFILGQNHPNPFNPVTTIEYNLPFRAPVTIEVFNTLGQKVRTLVNETKPAGQYRIEWDGHDNSGRMVATGVYLYRFNAGDVEQTRKMLFIK